MNQDKLADHAANVTTSRKGNKYSFTSPIPGVHIYDTNWEGSRAFFDRLDTDEFWEHEAGPGARKWIREDYLDLDTGKKSQTCWLAYNKEIEDAMGDIVDSYLAHWNLDPHSQELLRITKFEGKGDFFGMHMDDTFSTPRTTSMVYYATDDYVGGELEFIHFGVKVKPKAGQLFLFPSGYSYEHKVNPVIGGNEPRITIVSFFNQMTFEERENRRKYIDPSKDFYVPSLNYVLDGKLNGTDWPKY
jgi:hypothetical protein